jgi:uncharacterized protein YdaU (DUF1376 family)
MTDTLIYFPLYVGDLLKKFIEYPTFEERGAWLSIVTALIQNDGILVDDETVFFKCMIFDEKNKQLLKQMLSKCLKRNKKGWYSDDVNALIFRQKEVSRKRAEAGAKGGRKSSKKNKQLLKQSSSISKSKSIKKEIDKSISKEKTTSEQKTELPDWIDLEVWNGFLEMRKKKKKPATDYAKKLLIGKLGDFKKKGLCANRILQQSIVNGWTSVYEGDVKPEEEDFDWTKTEEFKEIYGVNA